MTRRLIAALIVVGLGAGVWFLWPRGGADGPTTTPPVAVATSTTLGVETTVTLPPSTITTSTEPAVVESVEDAEVILRELWFGWFEGIYNQDEERIREVVASQSMVEAPGRRSAPEFTGPPSTGVCACEILRSSYRWWLHWQSGVMSSNFRAGNSSGVFVIRRRGSHWKLIHMGSRGDLWEARLRIAIGTASIALLPDHHPGAEEFAPAGSRRNWDPLLLVEKPITRCRIAGGDIVDYASDDVVPGRLYPQPGTDITGPCWYYSSTDTNWRFAQLYADGDALLGYSSGGFGGGFAIVTGRLARCTSEPTPINDPAADVWEYITDYIHPPPAPDLNPPEGDGVTGLETFVGLPIPADHSAVLNSGGTLLEVEIDVSAVIVDWGDGTRATYPAETSALTGYPDGIATHVYEVKDANYQLTASYDWTARWRVSGGVWQPVAVPDTSTTVGYPVDEIVSVITG